MRTALRSLVALSAVLALAACSGGGSTTAVPSTGGPAAATAGATATPAASICTDPGADAATVVAATVAGNKWSSVTANVDDVITWTNSDGAPHRVELDDGRCGVMPNIKGDGGTQSLIFTEAGSFPFHCGVHPSMKGTIVIN